MAAKMVAKLVELKEVQRDLSMAVQTADGWATRMAEQTAALLAEKKEKKWERGVSGRLWATMRVLCWAV